jgi:hypothetical protein
MLEGWKKDEDRSRVFGTDRKEKGLLVGKAVGGIQRS